jgi:hypothetical protein
MPWSAAEEWLGDIKTWRQDVETVAVEASGSSAPVVICPGFGNNSADYIAPFGDEGQGLVSALSVRPIGRIPRPY